MDCLLFVLLFSGMSGIIYQLQKRDYVIMQASRLSGSDVGGLYCILNMTFKCISCILSFCNMYCVSLEHFVLARLTAHPTSELPGLTFVLNIFISTPVCDADLQLNIEVEIILITSLGLLFRLLQRQSSRTDVLELGTQNVHYVLVKP